ncbi:hypothetical protein BC832DRAFT_621052 [Gaertneriomyces semiglobifer]|nr:hypothetical protein BC832DRAFT_621052 [Gaertneriomyces semiglobifer]
MELAEKLGHPLPEIRERARDALHSKLKRGIISAESVGHETAIVRNLLKYIDVENLREGQTDESLQLLFEISEVQTVRDALLDVGAKETLVQLQELTGANVQAAALVGELLSRLAYIPHSTLPVSVGAADPIRKPSPTRLRQSLRASTTTKPYRCDLSTARTRRRTGSPERFQGTIKLSGTLPYLPNAIPSYDCVHLSALDDRVIQDFCALVSSSNPEATDIFHHLLCDHGPGVFLQRPRLFRTILAAATDGPQSRAFEYLDELMRQWPTMFQQTVDKVSLGYRVLCRDDVTLNATLKTSMLKADHLYEGMVSLPFACHEIFECLVPLLRHHAWIPPILRILHRTIPFLKLHLRTCIAHHDGELEHEAGDIWILDCVRSVLEAVEYLGHRAPATHYAERVDVQPQDQLIRFSITVLNALTPLCSAREETFTVFVEDACGLLTPNNIPKRVIRFLLRAKQQHSNGLILAWLLNHPTAWVRKHALEEIVTIWQSSPNLPPSFTNEEVTLALIANASVGESAELRRVVYNIIHRILMEESTSNGDHSAFRKSILPWLSLLEDHDGGELIEAVLSQAQTTWTKTDELNFWLRGLMHRNDGVREAAVRHIQECVPAGTNAETEDRHNALVLPAGVSEEMETTTRTGGVDEQLVRELSATLKDELTNLPRANELLRAVAEAKPSTLFTELLFKYSLMDTLLDACSRHSPRCFGSKHLLTVICTFIESGHKGLTVLRKRQDLLPILASHVFDVDLRVRYLVGRILTRLLFGYGAAVVAAVKEKYYTIGKLDEGVSASLVQSVEGIHLSELFDQDAVTISFTPGTQRFDQDGQIFAAIQQAVSKLHGARSHHEFLVGLDALRAACVCPSDYAYLAKTQFAAIITRILSVMPASLSDTLLLLSVIRTTTDAMAFPEMRVSLCSTLQKSLTILLPLSIAMIRLDDPTLVSTEDGDIDQEVRVTFTNALLRFTNTIMDVFSVEKPDVDLVRCIADIVPCLHTVYESGPCCMQMECARLFFTLSTQPALLTLFNDDLIQAWTHFGITALTSATVVGCRLRYLLALTLQNITALAESLPAWTSLGWVHDLLLDASEEFQAIGMEVLATLLRQRDNNMLELISNEFPGVMVWSVGVIGDWGLDVRVRAGAVHVFTGCWVACRQNPSRFVLLSGKALEEGVEVEMGILDLLSSAGVFTHVKQLLEEDGGWAVYRSHVMNLLILAANVDSAFVADTLLEAGAVHALVSYISQDTSSDDILHTYWRETQRNTHCSAILLSPIAKTLEFITLVSDGHPTLAHLLSSTPSFLHTLLTISTTLTETDSSPLLQPLLQTLAHFLPSFISRSDNVALLASHTPVLLQVSIHAISSRSAHVYRTGISFLARYVSAQYALSVPLEIDTTLEKTASTTTTQHLVTRIQALIVSYLTPPSTTFTTRMGVSHDIEDVAYTESLRLLAQTLFGCISICKAVALHQGMLASLMSLLHSTTYPTLPVLSKDKTRTMRLLVGVSLVRHLMAGSQSAKTECVEKGLVGILYDLLCEFRGKETQYGDSEGCGVVVVEVLVCVRNMCVGNGIGKQSVFLPQNQRNGSRRSVGATTTGGSAKGGRDGGKKRDVAGGEGGSLFEVLCAMMRKCCTRKEGKKQGKGRTKKPNASTHLTPHSGPTPTTPQPSSPSLSPVNDNTTPILNALIEIFKLLFTNETRSRVLKTGFLPHFVSYLTTNNNNNYTTHLKVTLGTTTNMWNQVPVLVSFLKYIAMYRDTHSVLVRGTDVLEFCAEVLGVCTTITRTTTLTQTTTATATTAAMRTNVLMTMMKDILDILTHIASGKEGKTVLLNHEEVVRGVVGVYQWVNSIKNTCTNHSTITNEKVTTTTQIRKPTTNEQRQHQQHKGVREQQQQGGQQQRDEDIYHTLQTFFATLCLDSEKARVVLKSVGVHGFDGF